MLKYASTSKELKKEAKIEVNDFLQLGLRACEIEEGVNEEEDEDDYVKIDFDSL